MKMFLLIFNAKISFTSFSQCKKFRKQLALHSFLTVKLQALPLIREVERTKNTK